MALDSTVKVKFLGDAANLAREAARASKATDAVGRSAENAHKHLSNMAKGFIAGASVGAAFYGVEKAVKSTVNAYKNAAAEASKLSRLTGLTAEGASRLGFAARETGVDMDDFTKAMGLLSKNLNNADKAQTVLTKTHHLAIEQVPRLVKGHIEYVAQLKNVTDVQKKVVPGTQSLGFALRDATGHLKPLDELLPKIADKFKNMQNGPEKTALALKLFGRNGAALLPFLNKGAEGLAAFAEEADKLGITMSGKDVDAYRQYVAAQRSFKAAIEGVKISLGRELFPVFAQWTQALADNGPMVAGYARELGQKIGPAAQRAATAIKDLAQGFKDGTGAGGELRGVLENAGRGAKFLADHAHGVKLAAEAMAAYWVAAKAAAFWNARLALSSVVTGLSGVALGAPAAAAGIEGVGAASTLAFPEVVALGAALLAVWKTWGMVKDLPRQLKESRNQPGVGTYRLQHAKEYGDPTGPDVTMRGGFVVHESGTSQRSDIDEIKAGRGKTAVVVSKARETARATKAAADTVGAANAAALAQEEKTAAAAQKAADAKSAAAEALQKATDKLRDALQSRLDTAKGIRDSLISSNSIVRDGVSWTAKDLLARFTVTMGKVKRFQSAISALVHKGFDQSIVQQVAAAGVQGGLGTAVGLAHASAGQVRQINATQRAIDKAAGGTGERVAGQMGPIQITSVLKVNDAVLARAVNTWNAQHGGSGHRLAG